MQRGERTERRGKEKGKPATAMHCAANAVQAWAT